MAKTTKLKLNADRLEWCKVYEHTRDLDGPWGAWTDEGGRYTVTAYLNEDEFNKLRDTGATKARDKTPDEDGLYKIQFTRKHEDKFEWASGAPKVVLPEGYTEDNLIGNGSKGIVHVDVYKTSRAGLVGTRLTGLTVTDMVEYIPDPDYSPEPELASEAPIAPEEDTEIPF